jgi:hypothetical protein
LRRAASSKYAVPVTLICHMSSGRSAITIGPDTAPAWMIVSID